MRREMIGLTIVWSGIAMPIVATTLLLFDRGQPGTLHLGFIIGIGLVLIGLMIIPRDPVPKHLRGKVCPHCRYDLRGIDSDICPECGAK